MKKELLLLFIIIAFRFRSANAQPHDTLSCSPNPFYPTATIHFESLHTDTFSLVLLDFVGQQLAVYFQNTVLPAGGYSIALQGENLAEGQYILALTINSVEVSRRKITKLLSASAITESSIEKGLHIFPNPVSGIITVKLEDVTSEQLLVQVMNSFGQLILEFSCLESLIAINTENLAKGLYLLRITDKDKIAQRKFIVE